MERLSRGATISSEQPLQSIHDKWEHCLALDICNRTQHMVVSGRLPVMKLLRLGEQTEICTYAR